MPLSYFFDFLREMEAVFEAVETFIFPLSLFLHYIIFVLLLVVRYLGSSTDFCKCSTI